MASQNLSPRQKMINMMYLVLTALLALNVSAEILDAFEDLREGMERSVDNFETNNDATVKLIRGHIGEELANKNTRNEYILPLVEEIQIESETMITLMTTMVSELEVMGEPDENGEITIKDERDRNYQYFMGADDLANEGRGNGKALELREKLDKYIQWANRFYQSWDPTHSGEKFRMITVSNDGDEAAAANGGHRTWEFQTFGNKPLVADLATVEKLKMDIQQVESELLKVIAEELRPKFTIDSLIAVTAPVADIVPAGSFYEAKIFVSMWSENLKPEFLGSGITINPDKTSATIKIPASASVIAAGATDGIQTWSATVKVPNADGGVDILPVSGKFRVRKPEVMIRSATIHSLYKDCGNAVVVEVPALGEDYNPDFAGSTGGQIRKKAGSKKSITIVPGSRKFVLDVKSNTNGQKIKVDKVEYDVILPPKPRIAMTSTRGREYAGAARVNKKGSVRIKIVPDAEFKDKLPQDAKYRVDKIMIKYASGIQGVRTLKTIDCRNKDIMKGVDVSLGSTILKNEPAGSSFYIELEGVSRINFEGKAVKVNFQPADLWKSGVLK